MKLRHLSYFLLAPFVASCAPDATDASPDSPFELSHWKLTLPTGDGEGEPMEVKHPQLEEYESEFFDVRGNADAITFRAPADGVPTIGSEFARTELREMTATGTEQAGWSNMEGLHVMEIRQSIDRLPASRPALVAGQIHGTDEYKVLIRLDGEVLSVKTPDGDAGILDPGYRLGTVFDVRLEASNGSFRVYYNDELKTSHPEKCDSCYFKAGVYLQSNPDWGDAGDSYGEVTVHDLNIIHLDEHTSVPAPS